METTLGKKILEIVTAVVILGLFGTAPMAASDRGRLSVAVTVDDVQAIARAVGGDQVETYTLFKGCILRKHLAVERAEQARLLKADAVVWTGFFNESAAIRDVVRASERAGAPQPRKPLWIDVSQGAKRINTPVSTCIGYVEASFMHGDPFFWLNPENGTAIADDLAEGFAELRPDKRDYFLANAAAFDRELRQDIARWQEELAPLKDLRIFSAQCGWQNLSQIGGPVFAACKGTPGQLPSPATLVDHVNQLKVDVILVDPNTPAEYGRAFRQQTHAKVIQVASSIEDLPGSRRSYGALFDNLVRALREAAKESGAVKG